MPDSPASPWTDLDRPPLSQQRLRRALVDSGVWRRLDVVASTTSTNADLAVLARAGEPSGAVLVAEEQTAGRGRLDRRWNAPPRAGLLLSVLLRPQSPASTWPMLPFVAGVAVAEAVRSVAGLDADLKWPNDILVGERKLGGILTERVDGAVVVGMGVNVSLRVDELPVPDATSVGIAGGVTDREALLKEVLRAFARRYGTWQEAGGAPESILPVYREICATIGRLVVASLPGGQQVTGRVSAVDDDGRLVVEAEGETVRVSAGDVVHVRGVS